MENKMCFLGAFSFYINKDMGQVGGWHACLGKDCSLYDGKQCGALSAVEALKTIASGKGLPMARSPAAVDKKSKVLDKIKGLKKSGNLKSDNNTSSEESNSSNSTPEDKSSKKVSTEETPKGKEKSSEISDFLTPPKNASAVNTPEEKS